MGTRSGDLYGGKEWRPLWGPRVETSLGAKSGYLY
jgi:hypothetical protein